MKKYLFSSFLHYLSVSVAVFLLFSLNLVWGQTYTATYTVANTTTVSPSGTLPSGSSATYSQTFGTAKQMTSGNSTTLTLSGFAGKEIKSIALEMRSNGSAGRGWLDMAVGSGGYSGGGYATIFSIPNNTFANALWNGSYTNSYVVLNRTITPSYIVQVGEEIIIHIAATTNSLYIQEYSINYEDAVISPTSPILQNETYTGTENVAFSEFPINSGDPATSWAVTNGTLPAGLSLDALTGEIYGTPTTAGTSTVDIEAINATGNSTGTYTITINPAPSGNICFSEDFSSLSNGDNISTGNSSSPFNGDATWTSVDKAYQAGGAVKLGASGAIGYIETNSFTPTSPQVQVTFDVKGWTNVEGDVKVTVGAQTHTFTYTAKMADPFETVTHTFTGVPVGSPITLKFETSAKRAFLDNISVFCASVASPPILQNETFQGMENASFSHFPINTGGGSTNWAVIAGTLPAGLSIDNTTGEVFGTPTVAGTTTVDIEAINADGNSSATYTIIVDPALNGNTCFSEDFSFITAGNSTATGGSGTTWNGTGGSNTWVVSRAYNAGGAVRLGTGSLTGSIETTFTPSESRVEISFEAKGWTSVEGDVLVTLGTQTHLFSYTSTMADAFETKSFIFNNVPTGSPITLKFETTAGRTFIDNIDALCIAVPNGTDCFSDDFSHITSGNNTTTNGSNSAFNGNADWTSVDKAYQAGSAVKIGSGSDPGYIETSFLPSSNQVEVSFDVKGWTTVLSDIIVTLGTQKDTIKYTAVMADPNFESVSRIFSNVPTNQNLILKFETYTTTPSLGYQVFIKNVVATCIANPTGNTCFDDDFSDITSGSNTSTTGSSPFNGNSTWTSYDKAYNAGGAIRVGTSTETGFIETMFIPSTNQIDIVFDAKGWTNVEGGVTVTLGDQSQTFNYSATVTDPFETISYSFTNVPVGTAIPLRFETTSKRTFIDNIIVSCVFTPQYMTGDVRPLIGNIDLSTAGTTPYFWEEYDGAFWSRRPQSPQADKPNRIFIDKENIGGAGNVTNTYSDIIVQHGGELVLNNVAGVLQDFIGNNKKLEIRDGGKVTVNGQIQMNSGASLIVRKNGELELNSSDIDNAHPIWNGTENFENGSYVTIKDWNWTANNTSRPLFNSTAQISNNSNGYKFGNLLLETTVGNDWTLVPSQNFPNLNLCENNLEIWDQSNTYFITGTSNDISGFNIGEDFIIYDGRFHFGTTFTGATNFTNNYTIGGDFVNISDDELKIHHVVAGNSTPAGTVTIHGNIEIGNTVTQVANDGNKKIELRSGTSSDPKIIDIQTDVVETTIEITDGYRALKNDLSFGNNSSFTVENGTTLDFGIDGTNVANNILNNGGTGNSFTLQDGGALVLTSTDSQGALAATGNIGNVQTNNRTYPANDANFVFKGLADQYYGTLASGAVPSKAKTVVIDNGANTLHLEDDFTVWDEFTMDGGNIKVDAGKVLELGENTTNVGILSYNSGYVLGDMKRWFNNTSAGSDASDLFPLGFDDNGIKNRFANIQFTGGTPSGSLTARFVGVPMFFYGLPIAAGDPNTPLDITFDVTTTEDQGFWNIEVTDGVFSTNETYTATMVGEGFNIINDVATIVLLKRANGGVPWEIPGNSGTGALVSGHPAVVRTGITSFSDFGFGGGIANPLPIQLIEFRADCEEDKTKISWKTGSETNNEKFIIEKSTNGFDWTVLQEVKGQGNTAQTTSYSIQDRNTERVTYYRLTQVDFDGKSETFDIVSSNCTNSTAYTVYPNPATNLINVDFGSKNTEKIESVVLTTLDGRVMSEKTNLLNVTGLTFDVSILSPGIYFVQILEKDGNRYSEKVVIRK